MKWLGSPCIPAEGLRQAGLPCWPPDPCPEVHWSPACRATDEWAWVSFYSWRPLSILYDLRLSAHWRSSKIHFLVMVTPLIWINLPRGLWAHGPEKRKIRKEIKIYWVPALRNEKRTLLPWVSSSHTWSYLILLTCLKCGHYYTYKIQEPGLWKVKVTYPRPMARKA